ncbi:MAG: hydrogenase iron-sulfur subunit, partial [ANME-2 cluster archaeon]
MPRRKRWHQSSWTNRSHRHPPAPASRACSILTNLQALKDGADGVLVTGCHQRLLPLHRRQCLHRGADGKRSRCDEASRT